jgi:hypothetical protein
MADEEQGIGGKYLDWVLSALGGAGGAAALKKAILVTPTTLRALGGAKSMHPAAAEAIGWRGSLRHPLAVKTQKAIDEDVMQNLSKWQTDEPTDAMINAAHKQGWQYGPMSGFAREIPDIGMKAKIGSSYIKHPGGDIHQALGLGPLEWTNNPEVVGMFHPLDNEITLNTLLKTPRQIPAFSQNVPSSYPGKHALQSVAAHELQHASHGEFFSQRPEGWLMPYSLRPWERESSATEYRYLNPQAYKYPFAESAEPGLQGYNDFLDYLKGKGNVSQNPNR